MRKQKPSKADLEIYKMLWRLQTYKSDGFRPGDKIEPADLPYAEARETIRNGRRIWIMPDGREIEAK